MKLTFEATNPNMADDCCEVFSGGHKIGNLLRCAGSYYHFIVTDAEAMKNKALRAANGRVFKSRESLAADVGGG